MKQEYIKSFEEFVNEAKYNNYEFNDMFSNIKISDIVKIPQGFVGLGYEMMKKNKGYFVWIHQSKNPYAFNGGGLPLNFKRTSGQEPDKKVIMKELNNIVVYAKKNKGENSFEIMKNFKI